MNCQDIQKLLKHFQADMLPDDTYQQYVAHLNTCEKCRVYVSRFGFLSNQVWELGQIRPPSDLAGSILFAIQHPGPKLRLPQGPRVRVNAKSLIWAGLASALIAVVVVAGLHRLPSSDQEDTTIVVESELVAKHHAEGPSLTEDSDDTAVLSREEKSSVELYAFVEDPSVAKPPQARYQALHWHMDLLTSKEGIKAEVFDRLEKNIKAKTDALSKIEREIGRLKGLEQHAFKQHYSPESQEAAHKESLEIAHQLVAMLDQQEQVQKALAGLKKEYNRLERVQKEQTAHRCHVKEECRAHILSALSLWRVGAEHSSDDVIVFRAPGNKVEQIYKEILNLEAKKCSLTDLSADVLLDPQGAYDVSISLPLTDANTRHWHMARLHGVQRSALENMILRYGGRLKYDADNNLIFVLSGTDVNAFEKALASRHFTYKEYSASCEQGNILLNQPVTVSIYFTQ